MAVEQTTSQSLWLKIISANVSTKAQQYALIAQAFGARDRFGKSSIHLQAETTRVFLS